MSAHTQDRANQTYELRRFGGGVAPDVRDIAALHAELLPRSPLALLGARFREEFYYRELPAAGLIFGAVAYVDAQAAGFVVATDDPDHFLMTAVRRKWPRLLWVLARSLAGEPRRLAAGWEAARIQLHRMRPSGGGGRQGEILSLGVLPQYRAKSDLQIARDLVRLVLETFQARGVRRVVAVIDADNRASLRFFEKLGFRPGRAEVPGWRHASTEVVWEAEENRRYAV
jgi:ribosomal protein S18 acetylase RimI-like enzyme